MSKQKAIVSGILNINKPPGLTSHDVVDRIRRLVGQQQVGHAGTLDPFATGVLLMLLGRATRLMEYAHALPKTYQAEITLGTSSDTDDVTGQITRRTQIEPPSRERIEEILKTFRGAIQQVPPAWAAVKIKGKKLYEYARAGESVKAQPRTVTIHRLTVRQYTYPKLRLIIECSSGTYIRALARDIGSALDTGAYVSSLERTAIGKFDIRHSIGLDKLSTTNLPSLLQPPKTLLENFPSVKVSPASVVKLKHGQPIGWGTDALPSNTPLALFGQDDDLIGIGYYHPTTSLLHPKKIL